MDLKNITLQVIEVAKQVGDFIHQEGKSFDKKHIEYKGKNDLVSYVDKEAEKRIIQSLKKILPEAAFVSEEDEAHHQLTASEFHWVIDPLDGTTNFLHGIPTFAVSIALMQGEEVVSGVVYEINRDEAFYAWKNGGAFLNDEKINISNCDSLQDGLLATGFPYSQFEKIGNYLTVLRKLMEVSHGLRRIGSAAVDLAYVAAGRFEGFFEFNLKAWDVAAGSLLVKEAGGKVSTFSGTNDFIFGKEIVVAPPKVHQEILAIIQEYW